MEQRGGGEQELVLQFFLDFPQISIQHITAPPPHIFNFVIKKNILYFFFSKTYSSNYKKVKDKLMICDID